MIRVSSIRRDGTHRLIPSRWADRSVLERVSGGPGDLEALFELEGATNDRLLGGANLLAGISVHELLFGVPHAHIVNAAFCHAHPDGGRFNGPDRGAWYASFELATAQAEVGFHKSVQLAEIDRFEESVTYDDYLADFSASFHDLRHARRFRACLDPASYRESQALAEELVDAGSLGVVYPSVRRAGGTCLACFRPALVANVRRVKTYRFTWRGRREPAVSVER